ncbi:MAG: TetR/AcrR family transcriptional regulator [Actinomycetota bacterium]
MSSGNTITRERYARGEGDRLRVDLLDAAAELMAEHGSVEGISLRAVARRAGVSPTAVYRHFDDHVDLLADSVTHCWTNFRDALATSFESRDDPFTTFREMGRAYVDFALERPGQYRVMFSNRVSPGDDRDSVGASAFEMLVDVVRQMLDARHDDRDPRFVAAQVHTWIHGIVDLIGCHPENDWPDVEQLLVGLDEALALTPLGAATPS